jgi:hypothetical protein
MNSSLARYLFGLAVLGTGVCSLVWRDAPNHAILIFLIGSAAAQAFIYVSAAVQVIAGVAILWHGTVRAGAIGAGAVFLVIALVAIEPIVRHPLVYTSWGNFFEQLSLLAGALIVYARSGPTSSGMKRLARIGYYTFAVCVISFALEQAFYLSATASFVPKWIPLGQNFWAIATTVAFGLAAIAMLTGIQARLAAYLNAAMVLGFGVLVWLPVLFVDPHTYSNWSETMETFTIAAIAWMAAETAETLRDRRG